MPLKYTTTDSIARKLRGRLRIENSPSVDTALGTTFGYQNPLAGWTVDNDLIEQVGNQEESLIDLYLYQVYRLPLQLTSEITKQVMADISEGLIIATLIKVHFQGNGPITPTADVSNIGVNFYSKAIQLLAAITASHDLYISVNPPVPRSQKSVPQLQPLVLPEEIVLTRFPDTVTRNYSQVVKRNSATKTQSQYFSEESYIPRPIVPPTNRTIGIEPDPCINPHNLP